MINFALIFPGQGSQSLGMLADLSQKFSCVKKIFSDASDILHYDLWNLTQQDAEKLDQTEFTQPALLAADMAVYECWKLHNDKTPQFLAGHSLGEYAALVVANAIHFNDAISLVSFRGQFMQNAVKKGEGAMAAIVGLDDDVVVKICNDALSVGIVSPANYNSIGQIVIAGEIHAVEKAITLAQEKGAKLAKKIPVSVPSHCALMKSAAEKMAEKLKGIEIKTPTISVIQNADVKIFHSPDDIRNSLIKQLTLPVRWVETIRYMIKKNCKLFLECGPGKVLVGLNRRISQDIVTNSMQNEADIRAAIGLVSV